MISVLQLGVIDYATALRLQQRLVELRKEERIGNLLLLLEHTPVITLGRNAKAANVTASRELLAERSVEVFECDRGGDVTFHGPGQLVGYPIFDLRSFSSQDGKRKSLGAVEYVRRLEEVLIRTCAAFAIPAKRIPGLTGVWTDPETNVDTGHVHGGSDTDALARPAEQHPTAAPAIPDPPTAKIAAIGVHISRGVTSHGFALNVTPDLSFFDLIIPCGITSKPVTSMTKELNKPVAMQDVAHSISRNFGTIFQSQMLWLESLDDLLGHSLGVPVRPPADLRKLHKDKDKDEDTFWA